MSGPDSPDIILKDPWVCPDAVEQNLYNSVFIRLPTHPQWIHNVVDIYPCLKKVYVEIILSYILGLIFLGMITQHGHTSHV